MDARCVDPVCDNKFTTNCLKTNRTTPTHSDIDKGHVFVGVGKDKHMAMRCHAHSNHVSVNAS